MLKIVTLGLPLVSSSPSPRLKAGDADEQASFEGLVSKVAPASDDEVVLVFLPERDAEPRLSRLLAARSALESTRVVIHPTALPPLAAGALADLVAGLVHQRLVSDGALLGQLPLLEQQVVAVARLGSVAKLRHPSPAVSLHARSFLPGSSFLAVVDEDPRVMALHRKDTSVELPPPRLDGGWKVVLATGADVDDGIVRRSLAARLPGVHLATPSLTDASTSWWGTTQLVELAFVPAYMSAVATLLGAAAMTTCAWCGQEIVPGRCPFCRFDRARVASATDETIASGGSV